MMPIGMSRSVSARLSWPPARRARLAAMRGGDAARDRAHDSEQGPDGRDAHRAGADEAHLLAEGRSDQGLDVGRRAEAGEARLPGDEDEPADDEADEHGDADGHADQVADADQRHRKAGGDGRRAGAEAEAARGFLRGQPGAGSRIAKAADDDRAPDDQLAGRGGSPRRRRRPRRPSGLPPPRRLPDRGGRTRSRALASAARSRARRGCRRSRSPRPKARRGSRSTSRP